MNHLSFFPRPRRNDSASHRAERRTDAIERRLSRTEQDLIAREAALAERERNVRRKERNIESEGSAAEAAGSEVITDTSFHDGPGDTSPGRVKGDTADFILSAHAMAQGKSADVPLPIDKTAKLIAMAARGELPDEKSARHRADATAQMIINADRVRRGADLSELT